MFGLNSYTVFAVGDFKTLYHVKNQVLQSVQKLLKGQERALCFNMSVFCQVSACSGLFYPAGLGNAEHSAQSLVASLQVQLRGVNQKCLLPEIVKVEENSTT